MNIAPSRKPRPAYSAASPSHWRAGALALLCALLALGTARPAVAAGAAAAGATERLHALFRDSWQKELAADPLTANYLGDNRYNDRWPDLSAAGIASRQQHDRDTLAALRSIARSELSSADQLNYDLFAREYEQRIATAAFKPWLYQINHQGGIQTLSEVTELLSFSTVKDYEDWIARLDKVGTLVDQHIALLEQAVREKRTQPRAIMQRVPPQLALQTVANAEQSPFYAPFKRFPESIGAADRARLAAAGRAAIERTVLPAYAMQSLLRATYEETLDCPGLAELRSDADILEGHRRGGRYEPALWTVLRVEGRDAGAALLNRTPASDAIELTYLGLAKWARGKGLGSLLLAEALWKASQAPERVLTLAVDDRNQPAHRLYRRCGFRTVARRRAFAMRVQSST